MKKLFLVIWLLSSSYSYSQELMNFYVEPNGNPNSVTLHTKVFYFNVANYIGFQENITDNIITLSLCYFPTIFTIPTFDNKDFEITLPTGYTNYIININLYGDNVTPCPVSNLIDSGSVNFDFPYNPTETTNVPDNNFEALLEDLGFGDDIPNNALVFTHRIRNIQRFFLNNQEIPINGPVADVTGLEDFVGLRYFDCRDNLISILDVSNSPELVELTAGDNTYSVLDLSQNPNLINLVCSSLTLSTLNLDNNVLLESLLVGGNFLSSLNLSNNVNLKNLRLRGTGQFNTVDLSQNTLLEYIDITSTPLTTLDLSNNLNLEIFDAQFNELTSINFSGLTNLVELRCQASHLINLDLSTNSNLS